MGPRRPAFVFAFALQEARERISQLPKPSDQAIETATEKRPKPKLGACLVATGLNHQFVRVFFERTAVKPT